MNFNDKKEIRKYIIQRRDEMEATARDKCNARIIANLMSSDYYKCANTIFTFVSFGSEVDTHGLIAKALKDGKTIAVPKIKTKEQGIEVFQISDLGDLKPGYYGILEPVDGCPTVKSDEFDLILMPGVAFDRQGGRVGYGAGYYDRYLAAAKKAVTKIALGYSLQLVEHVPTDYFDILIDGIITENEIISFKK